MGAAEDGLIMNSWPGSSAAAAGRELLDDQGQVQHAQARTAMLCGKGALARPASQMACQHSCGKRLPAVQVVPVIHTVVLADAAARSRRSASCPSESEKSMKLSFGMGSVAQQPVRVLQQVDDVIEERQRAGVVQPVVGGQHQAHLALQRGAPCSSGRNSSRMLPTPRMADCGGLMMGAYAKRHRSGARKRTKTRCA